MSSLKLKYSETKIKLVNMRKGENDKTETSSMWSFKKNKNNEFIPTVWYLQTVPLDYKKNYIMRKMFQLHNIENYMNKYLRKKARVAK